MVESRFDDQRLSLGKKSESFIRKLYQKKNVGASSEPDPSRWPMIEGGSTIITRLADRAWRIGSSRLAFGSKQRRKSRLARHTW